MKHTGEHRLVGFATRKQKANENNVDHGIRMTFKQDVYRSTLLEIFDQHQISALLNGIYDEHGGLQTVGMKTIALDNEFDCTVRVEIGLNSFAVLEECELKGIKLEPKPGGLIGLSFQLYASPDEDDAGHLVAHSGHVVKLEIDGKPATANKGKQPAEQQRDMLEEADDERLGLDDPKYPDVVNFVLEAEQVDEEAIQVNFGIGYAATGAILEAMEGQGLLNKVDGQYQIVETREAS